MQQHTRLTEEDRSNLVAFLDGELSDEEAQGLEAKLARSLSARKEVEALEKTWTMLDWLPRTEAPADFTDQTISRIHAQQMQAERIEGRLKWLSLLSGKAIGWAACVVAAVAIGFAGVRYAWPDPSRGLIQDLEIVDNLELYREVPDIKFLDDLSLLTIFAPAAPTAGDEAAASKPGAEPPRDSAAAPAQPPVATRLERMSVEQRRETWERYRKFLELPPAEQQRIRRLYVDLKRRPASERDRLNRVLVEYKKWKDGLPLYQRQALDEATPKGTIELYSVFVDMRKRQEVEDKLRTYWLLPPEAKRWVERVLPKLSPEEIEYLDQTPPLERPEKLFAYAVQHGVVPASAPLRPNLLRGRPPLPPIEDERLREFARKLPQERKDELSAFGRRRVKERLLELYYESHPEQAKERQNPQPDK